MIASILAAAAQVIAGSTVRWLGCAPTAGQRVYIANHSSHFDFIVLWSYLPPPLRRLTRPEIEVIPVYLENLNRILPKGHLLPVPMLSRITFGAPLHLQPAEEKDAFLERARQAVRALKEAA